MFRRIVMRKERMPSLDFRRMQLYREDFDGCDTKSFGKTLEVEKYDEYTHTFRAYNYSYNIAMVEIDILATFRLHPDIIDEDWTWHLKKGDILLGNTSKSKYRLIDVFLDYKGVASSHDIIYIVERLQDGEMSYVIQDSVRENYILLEEEETANENKPIKNTQDETLPPFEIICLRDTPPIMAQFFSAYNYIDAGAFCYDYDVQYDCTIREGQTPIPYKYYNGNYYSPFRLDILRTAKENPAIIPDCDALNYTIGTHLINDRNEHTEVLEVFLDDMGVIEKNQIVFILDKGDEVDFVFLEDMTEWKPLTLTNYQELYAEVSNNNQSMEEGKGEFTMEKLTTKNTTIELNKIIGMLDGYVVKDERITVSANGIAVHNRAYNIADNSFYDVTNMEFAGIPAGFKMPTGVENIKLGDVVFTSKNMPVIVSEIKDDMLMAFNPENETVIQLLPTKNMLGIRQYDLLITPFNFQNSINPFGNICMASVMAYQKGGTDEIVDVLLPQIMPLLAYKIDMQQLLQNGSFRWIAPALLIGMDLLRNKSIDFSNKEGIKQWCATHKKEAWLLTVALLVLLYIYKDSIANKLLTDRIAKIPLLGKLAPSIGKMLLKMPKIQNKLIATMNKTDK